jgi:hypothetical protein
MPCRVETDPVHGLARVRAEGPIGVQDVFSAIVEVWRQPAWEERSSVLWDLRHADLTGLKGAEVREIVGLERRDRPSPRRARMAILVSSDFGYGMARMVAALVDREPIEVEIFRDDEQSAWLWLEEPTDGAPA